MKIAISQREIIHNNIIYDCLEQGWYNLLSGHNLIPIPNISAVETDFDMLILSGGDNTPTRRYIETLYYHIALLKGIPILGVCHGAFFINEFYNGKNSSIEGHKHTAHQIEIEGHLHYTNSFHTNSIGTLGYNLIPLAVCPSDNSIEAFKHKNLPIWGLVWHPERSIGVMPKDLKEIIQ